MILQLEDRWGTLALFEYEHGSREALLALWRAGDLKFQLTADPDKEDFIRNTAAAYAAQSFRQAKEFFRHAETSSWLVKPLLLYYGMLTAAKASITFSCADFFLTPPSKKHGLSRSGGSSLALFSDSIKVHQLGVFQLARNAIGGNPIPPGSEILIDDILRRLPEVVVAYKLVARGADARIILTRNPWVVPNEQGETRIVFELPRKDALASVNDLPESLQAEYDLLPQDANSQVNVYVSKCYWKTQRDAQLALERGEPSFLSPTLNGGTAAIFPTVMNGTKYQLTEIELILLITFYFSEIARYMPHVWLQLHSGHKDFSVLLCQDAIRSCENKFLQLLQKQLTYTITMTMQNAAGLSP